ncbi:peptidase family M1-domain-containing protein [Polychytrium aggregatum]|uniref:peptidase family M1-domain-containing protein n=1 Tax=Polychytrium aggregatum TaxID=110093 RepID=UPI0022FE375B|nr:peptidase family M1-domain-containing protein [Polychytrium aggregatum]KAI9207265.1 peptidase family M1-domain-containing protein [Polychytrium aggregatum]
MTSLPPISVSDKNSFANSDAIRSTHLHLSLTADFDRKVLHGHVVHSLSVLKDSVKELVLDSSYIDVKAVTINGTDEALEFVVHDRHAIYGSPVQIRFPRALAKGEEIAVKVVYSTTKDCTAIQWLEPSQTVGKKHPYLFTQCQAIHARSLVPCQDTPSIKIKYSADVTAPAHLRALMSAVPKDEVVSGSHKKYNFDQAIAIPSYLIALAVGNLEGRKIGPRSTVWSEPEMVEASAWEFVETEDFIATGEKLLTPYCWGVYDLLVLPGSFPYGGMENPCLTFVTPTLLAGDRSLVDVVAHELAHSWMGNLVTSSNWEHFWLNEGWTMFVERKIIGRIRGNAEAEFSAIVGLKALKESIDHYDEIKTPQYTALVPELGGVDPDDSFSSVPYEKGFNLLYYLEVQLGGPSVFEPFVTAYVERFSHKSITTTDFKSFLYEYFNKHDHSKIKVLDAIDWHTWFHGQGYPPVKNEFDQTLAKACDELAKRWDSARASDKLDFSPEDIRNFSSTQTVVFLEKLLELTPLPHKLLAEMDKVYSLTSVRNAEIRFRWQWLCLKADYEAIFPAVAAFLVEAGRMKYVRPLYRAWDKTTNGGPLARKTFLDNRSFYHPICAAMVAKDLGL